MRLLAGNGDENPVPRRLGGAAGGGRVKEMAKYDEIGLKGSCRFLKEGFSTSLPKVGDSCNTVLLPCPKLRGTRRLALFFTLLTLLTTLQQIFTLLTPLTLLTTP